MAAIEGPRDLDSILVEILRRLSATERHWRLTPVLAADPVDLRDGMVWIRGDTNQLCWRANATTYRATGA